MLFDTPNTSATHSAPTETEPVPSALPQLDIDAMAAAALHRVTTQINRAAGQHMRAWRKTYATQDTKSLLKTYITQP